MPLILFGGCGMDDFNLGKTAYAIIWIVKTYTSSWKITKNIATNWISVIEGDQEISIIETNFWIKP